MYQQKKMWENPKKTPKSGHLEKEEEREEGIESWEGGSPPPNAGQVIREIAIYPVTVDCFLYP